MLTAMGDQVLLLVIGFALTSVLGGALGFFFQTRSWTHQHRAQRRDQLHEHALKVVDGRCSASALRGTDQPGNLLTPSLGPSGRRCRGLLAGGHGGLECLVPLVEPVVDSRVVSLRIDPGTNARGLTL